MISTIACEYQQCQNKATFQHAIETPISHVAKFLGWEIVNDIIRCPECLGKK